MREYETSEDREQASTRKRRRSGSPTLHDVARKAGVSLMSVSLVVNGRAGRLAPETRDRIEQAISAVNYRPNAAARSLRLARGTSVGMIILDAAPQFLAAPFTTQLVAGLSNRLGKDGHPLTLQGVPPDQIGRALAMRYAGVDGLCLLMGGAEADRRRVLDGVAALGIPVVLFQEAPAALADCCRVCQDDHSGGQAIARHLMAAGARRLVMLVPGQNWFSMQERRRGVTSVVQQQPGAAVEALDCGDESVASTRAALADWLDRHGLPDAVVAGNDRMATAALLELRQRGISIPDAVMITGFNGFPPRDVVEPLLTTICSPAYEMGEKGAEAMLGRLTRGRFEAAEILLEVGFLAGDSTRPAALA
jgi:DNA-binding LacI/PurR family transcriptional regulator